MKQLLPCWPDGTPMRRPNARRTGGAAGAPLEARLRCLCNLSSDSLLLRARAVASALGSEGAAAAAAAAACCGAATQAGARATQLLRSEVCRPTCKAASLASQLCAIRPPRAACSRCCDGCTGAATSCAGSFSSTARAPAAVANCSTSSRHSTAPAGWLPLLPSTPLTTCTRPPGACRKAAAVSSCCKRAARRRQLAVQRPAELLSAPAGWLASAMAIAAAKGCGSQAHACCSCCAGSVSAWLNSRATASASAGSAALHCSRSSCASLNGRPPRAAWLTATVLLKAAIAAASKLVQATSSTQPLPGTSCTTTASMLDAARAACTACTAAAALLLHAASLPSSTPADAAGARSRRSNTLLLTRPCLHAPSASNSICCSAACAAARSNPGSVPSCESEQRVERESEYWMVASINCEECHKVQDCSPPMKTTRFLRSFHLQQAAHACPQLVLLQQSLDRKR